MLGLAIQGLSISNWKPTRLRCKLTGKCTEATNASKEMTSANSLMSRSRRGISRINRPPSAGIKVTSERTIGLRLAVFIGHPSSNSHPNHVGDHHGAAGGHPPCIRPQITRLHVASLVRQVASGISGIVHRGINHSLVHPVPQDVSGSLNQRFDEKDGV